ncbi:hypothetical protein Trydic_g11250 [Trypoxylus dichotomus]
MPHISGAEMFMYYKKNLAEPYSHKNWSTFSQSSQTMIYVGYHKPSISDDKVDWACGCGVKADRSRTSRPSKAGHIYRMSSTKHACRRRGRLLNSLSMGCHAFS